MLSAHVFAAPPTHPLHTSTYLAFMPRMWAVAHADFAHHFPTSKL